MAILILCVSVSACTPLFCERYGERTAGDVKSCGCRNLDLTGDNAGGVYVYNRYSVSCRAVIVYVKCYCAVGSNDACCTVDLNVAAVVRKNVEHICTAGTVKHNVGKCKICIVLNEHLNRLACYGCSCCNSTVLDGNSVTAKDLEAES